MNIPSELTVNASDLTLNMKDFAYIISGVIGAMGFLILVIVKMTTRNYDIKFAQMETRITAAEKKSEMDEKSLRDSQHELRTTIGTTYATRLELERALEKMEKHVDKGFADMKEYIKERTL